MTLKLVRLSIAVLLALLALDCVASAQTGRNPFAIAGGESAGVATGLTGTILAWQSKFHMELQAAAKALKTSDSAFWTLAGASFAYGVFHAAGPGHGKAVLASYMIASETALRRGMVLAALAALLQGCVAIALVWAAAKLLGATALQMQGAANVIELASYGAIASLGAVLVWKKGAAFWAALRPPPIAVMSGGGFYCEAVDSAHIHSASCGHLRAADPATLERGFFWSGALGAVVAAGLRPCSGAILDSRVHPGAGHVLGWRERRAVDVRRHGHHHGRLGGHRCFRPGNRPTLERPGRPPGVSRGARPRTARGGPGPWTGRRAAGRRGSQPSHLSRVSLCAAAPKSVA